VFQTSDVPVGEMFWCKTPASLLVFQSSALQPKLWYFLGKLWVSWVEMVLEREMLAERLLLFSGERSCCSAKKIVCVQPCNPNCGTFWGNSGLVGLRRFWRGRCWQKGCCFSLERETVALSKRLSVFSPATQTMVLSGETLGQEG
jgi:hypothetical protein